MKKIIKDILLICSITAALFVVSEALLRLMFPRKVHEQSSVAPKDPAFEFDKECLILLKPNIQKTFISAKGAMDNVTWRTNSHSFRGEELDKSADLRIIVYGDSNVQARFSELRYTFSYKLEKYLEDALDENIEVVNAGVVGFGPDQSLIRFSKEVDTYKPDIVILHIFADNDFGDIIRNRLFDLDPEGNLVSTDFTTEPDEQLTGNVKYKSDSNAFLSNLFLVKGVRKVIKYILPEHRKIVREYTSISKAEFKVYEEKSARRFSHFADHYDLDLAIFPENKSSRTKVNLMERVLKRAQYTAKEKGVELIVLIQPSVIDLTENYKLSYKHLDKYPGYKRSNLTDTVKNLCAANKIYKINLFDAFLMNEPDKLFFEGNNNHWNNLGQDLAARETKLHILKILGKNSKQ